MKVWVVGLSVCWLDLMVRDLKRGEEEVMLRESSMDGFHCCFRGCQAGGEKSLLVSKIKSLVLMKTHQ